MRLILVRHGESVGNLEWRLQGQKEFALTERGRQQAGALARRLSRLSLAAVYSSPIQRALETAETIAAPSGLTVQPEPGVQEYDFGELSGLTWREINDRAPEVVAAVRSRRAEYPQYPGEEGRDSFRRRVCDALWAIAEEHKGEEQVLVVTHAGPIVVFLLDALGRDYQRPMPFRIDNGSLTTVEVPDGQGPTASLMPRAILTGLNDTCHLSPD